MLSLALGLALWIGLVALQLADVILTASRVPQLSGFVTIRNELVDAASSRLSPEEIDGFRDRLTVLDEREATRAVPVGRTATRQLWRYTPWRLIPVALSVIPFALTIGLSAVGLIALALPAISYTLAIASTTASVAAAEARAVVHSRQRAEIDELLIAATRASRAKVAGLGDRVARALQILREQDKPQAP